MKAAVIACASVTLMAGAMFQASAVERTLTPERPAYLLPVADSDFSAKKDEYMAQVKREMEDWGDKLHHAGRDAQERLDGAWTATKEAAGKLQVASSTQWDRAKQGFESALQDLKDRWRQSRPDSH